MAIAPQRDRHVEHVLASTRLSGCQPSARFLELTDHYRKGVISASEMVAQMREHYQLRERSRVAQP
ncbi:hypothetical protein AXW93_03655 [Pseudomonas aeruginosa]|uniref:antitoxin VbhA family protein n=1 Tax=Pseudomonas aeruginosa TaxID=287 RepID=UPI0009B9E3EE|nr:hypothetical protein AXW93_03655 [Pseudomonas aeruginosa]